MGKKTLDPNAVAALLTRGKQEATKGARVEEVPAKTSPAPKEAKAVAAEAQPAPKTLEKRYLTLSITSELFDALYDYQLEYRKTNPRKNGLHPGIGGATERLLRQALKLPSLEANNHAST